MGLTVSVHGGSNFPGLGPTCLLCVCARTHRWSPSVRWCEKAGTVAPDPEQQQPWAPPPGFLHHCPRRATLCGDRPG